ncbi:hypothetical protein BT67DRAFT_229024 [Trichocladium antarcticum]|uniref:Heterokaryon incompatibility domain-containing protein n=1 Tax=Trichocladium antarcticum TaxID=1450529 RepID=A0AAN6ZEC5_9PEZI|nr:hypothetical protein BT67DRAFT_229024 [Trichocladium antarcticum]
MAENSRDPYAERKTAAVLSSLGQRLLTLSDTNKAEFLTEASQVIHSDQSRAEAAAILSRLRDLNPEVACQFHPKEDALSSLCLRMINASTGPPVRSPGDQPHTPSFVVVSYCWHYPQWPLAPAATPISPGWEISQPMTDAVMALRQTPDEAVWVDKLCINQDDEADKTAHIAAMDAIYRSARRAAILLEDIQLDADEEQAALAYAGFYADLCREVKDGGLEGQEKSRFVGEYFPRREDRLHGDGRGHILAAAKPFAMKLLDARWFSRAWCAHESRMTRHRRIDNPLFMCFGADGKVLSFEFRFVHYLALYLSDLEPPLSIVGRDLTTAINDPSPKTLRQRWWRIQRLMPNTNPDESALQHLVSVLSFGCFKKGDLMSIALNTAGIPLYFGGQDVQSVEEIIWRYSLLVLASGDVIPLVASGPKLKIPAAGRDILSWATNPDRGALDARLPNQLPDSITAITREYIELDLLVFDSGPKPASPDSQAKAARLIADHDLYTLADNALSALDETTQSTLRLAVSEMTRINPTSKPLQALVRNILSLALDNGLDWILAFPTALQTTTASPSWIHGPIPCPPNPALLPAAHGLLSLLSPPPRTSPALLLQNTLRALTTLLDPRLHILAPNPRNIPLGTALGAALLTTSTSNRSYVALPTCLAHVPACYSRAWIVEPFDPDAAPERAADWLPPADLRIVDEDGAGGEAVDKVEDVLPVLGSDHEDRRAKRDDGRATWRVRRRQVLWGGLERWGDVIGGMGGVGEGQGVVLLRRQRVYGAEDYPWKEINSAMKKVMGGVKRR